MRIAFAIVGITLLAFGALAYAACYLIELREERKPTRK